jgi:preprotein translocase subunit SecD
MSEYIPRLREELVAAAARERAGERRRVVVRPRRLAPVLAGAVLAVAAVLAVSTIDLGNDERPVPALPAGTELAYRVVPAAGGDAAEAAQVLRARLAASGFGATRVTVTGDRLAVDTGGADPKTVAALAVPGELRIYDWEASVLGPDGRPAPRDDDVTGGSDAGRLAAVSRDEAVRRAAKAEGARVVQAEGAPDRWYALGGGAALSNTDIAQARAATDPMTGDPIVEFDFTSEGRSAFRTLTRTVAERGAAAMQPTSADPMRGAQHLAIVLDDRIMSVPFIDPRQTPDGIDGRRGGQIQGGLSAESARILATILNSGPLPATLEPF